LAHLESGAPLQEAREQALAATRRLVRRQTTWLRNLPGVAWLEVTGDSHPRALAQEIAVQFSKNSE
ncbi:MAG: tRNA (adenosine(37)-N6)-dimethylallyltransferase MiaA, partial [Planctomycetes bacterium]|nr:tRNA (adenosine(37)-N6)-dimethylallyltransferase MiaA [Planctomycetota bacterium]